MANDQGFTDPFVVSKDDDNGIAANGDDIRLALGGLVSPAATANVPFAQTGIFPGSYSSGGVDLSLSVTATAPASMGVTLYPGAYVVSRGVHSVYLGALTQTKTVPIPAADPSFARWDLLVLRTRDPGLTADAPVTKSAFTYVIGGTPSATPTKPTATDGDLPLAYVYVTANTSSITSGNVLSNLAPYVVARGGVQPASLTNPQDVAGTYVGQLRDWPSSASGSALERWDGAGWRTMASADGWTYYPEPVLYAGWPSTTTTVNLGSDYAFGLCRGNWIGKTFQFSMTFIWGNPPYTRPPGLIFTMLPTGISANSVQWVTTVLTTDDPTASVQFWLGSGTVSGEKIILYFPDTNNPAELQGYYLSFGGAGNAGTGYPRIPNGFPDGSSLTISGTIETTDYAT